ncbi:MAG: hypothetical protein DRO04_02625 [Candidatus Iainarchaeum archaeon]|uniref:Uncharacterized protein n=1 Tax=Candidatus Iainarchaeum sp. TaxID=3101447 RepID=A0A497JG06_9ARCH|nr:MAG: hypothetical protein DRO04_02625 [Candidatus Diapherotrites archaeon]
MSKAAFKQGYHLGFLHGYLFAANRKIFLPDEEAVKDHAFSLEEATRGIREARRLAEPVIRDALELVEGNRVPRKELLVETEKAVRELERFWGKYDG